MDRCRKLLEEKGLLDAEAEALLREHVDAEVEDAVRFAEDSPFPEPDGLSHDPYA